MAIEIHPLVSVVILSWNRRDDLRTTLQHVFAMDYSPFEVIVVDNNSNDGSIDMVKSGFPQALLVSLKKNIGIAGWNEGFRIAKGEFALVLDDDSYPEISSVQRAVNKMIDNPDCGIIAFHVYNQTRQLFETDFLRDYPGSMFVGCGALFRTVIFDKSGMFDPALFLYVHEVEFAMRVRNTGYKILFDPTCLVFHTMSSQNRGGNSTEIVNRRFLFYNTRNHFIVLLLHFPLRRIIFRIIRIFLGRLVFGVRNHRTFTVIKASLEVIKFLAYIRNNKVILRKEIQMIYSYGGFAGGLFCGDARIGFDRPSWLSDLPKLPF